MDEFPAALAVLAILGGLTMVGMLGFGLGKADLRFDYHQCIELGAPQQNCVDKFLGVK